MFQANSEKKFRRLSKSEWLVFVLILCGAIISFLALETSAKTDGLLKVYFLNVGQGDAQFIQAPNGNQVLIDGGPNSGILQELSKIMPFYDRSIDLVILTHPHADHLTGLLAVLKRYQVSKIIENYVPYETSEYSEWNQAKLQSQVIEAENGQIVDLGDGVKLNIIYPLESGSIEGKVKNPHDFMIVSRLDYGEESVLFTGDMEDKIEKKLVGLGVPIESQFLKVGHHGSKTSTTEEFLKAVKPLVAFIGVGARNRYGHPHPTVLQRLENFGIKYYRMDIDGTKELALDGKNYLIK